MNRHESDNLNAGYCEFLTPVKASGKYLLMRILVVAVAILLSVTMFVLTLNTIPVVSFMCLVLIIFFSWFVFQFTKLEYEYVIATGELTLTKILGARTRKDILRLKTSDIFSITPLSDIKSLAIPEEKVFYACNKDDGNAVCLGYNGDHGEKKVLVISAPSKTVSCFKYYRRSAFSSLMNTK